MSLFLYLIATTLKPQVAIVVAVSLSQGPQGVCRPVGSTVVSGGECFSGGMPPGQVSFSSLWLQACLCVAAGVALKFRIV